MFPSCIRYLLHFVPNVCPVVLNRRLLSSEPEANRQHFQLHSKIWWTDILHMPLNTAHDDVIKCSHFPRYWPFVRGIHWSPVNSSHNCRWCGALMFSYICVWINGWVNNREAGDFETLSRPLWRHCNATHQLIAAFLHFLMKRKIYTVVEERLQLLSFWCGL